MYQQAGIARWDDCIILVFNVLKCTLCTNPDLFWDRTWVAGCRNGNVVGSFRIFLPSSDIPDLVMEFLYLLIIFLAGGGMVAGTTWIADLIDPKYGGILAVAPIITTLSFVFTSIHASQERTQALVLGSMVFLIPTALFLISFYLLLNRYGFIASIIGSYGIWLVSVVIVAKLTGLL
jgi:uncharacterized membrane protein (GlpM family)